MMTMMMTTPCSRSEVCFQAEKGIGVSGSAAAQGFNDDNDDNDAEEEGTGVGCFGYLKHHSRQLVIVQDKWLQLGKNRIDQIKIG